jgi:hypothetical protein
MATIDSKEKWQATVAFGKEIANVEFVPDTSAVSDIKKQLEKAFGIQKEHQKLVYKGKELPTRVDDFVKFMKSALGDSCPRRFLNSAIARTHNGKIDRQKTMAATINGAPV